MCQWFNILVNIKRFWTFGTNELRMIRIIVIPNRYILSTYFALIKEFSQFLSKTGTTSCELSS